MDEGLDIESKGGAYPGYIFIVELLEDRGLAKVNAVALNPTDW